jgi:probable addiction module antidote protein
LRKRNRTIFELCSRSDLFLGSRPRLTASRTRRFAALCRLGANVGTGFDGRCFARRRRAFWSCEHIWAQAGASISHSAAGRSSCCLPAVRNGLRKPTLGVPRYWLVCSMERGVIVSKRSKVADLAQFDAAHYLDNESSIAAYLTDILEANDAALLAAALGDLARARGMTEIAKAAGITREALYKALRPDSAPRFDTVSRVCAALGVRLVA